MRRVAIIVAVWLGLVVGVALGAYRFDDGAALGRGWTLYGYREALKKQIRGTARARPGIVWLGDSTMLGLTRPSYPQMLQGVLPDVSARVLGFIASDFFTYYPVVGALLTVHRPAVLVMVAHLRLFNQPADDPTGYSKTRNDLVSLIPTADLPRALGLPFAVRGMSIPRVLLARLLRYQAIERFFYFLEGAHTLVAEAKVPWLGPNEIDVPGSPLYMLGVALEGFDVPITRRHPTVRMMEATVRLAHDAGVHVIVVGTPLPYEAMRSSVGYDQAIYDARFAVLRSAVEDAGGVFLDLHEALRGDMFVDAVGHFSVDGARQLAERVRPVVADELRRHLREDYLRNHGVAPAL
jgi:hypothetical protein